MKTSEEKEEEEEEEEKGKRKFTAELWTEGLWFKKGGGGFVRRAGS